MLAFNWFFLPPTHTLQLADSENWVALAVYLVTAVSVSWLAARRRRLERERRREDGGAAVGEPRPALADHRDHAPRARSRAGDVSAAERAELLESIRRRPSGSTGSSRTCSTSRGSRPAPRARLEVWPVDSLVARALDAVGPASDAGRRVAARGPARGPRRRDAARARARQPARERAEVLASRRRRRRRRRERRRRLPRRRPRPGDLARPSGKSIFEPFAAARAPTARAAPASASRSRAASSRSTAAASGSSRTTAAARRSRSRCPR